jgi:hypothetical protein
MSACELDFLKRKLFSFLNKKTQQVVAAVSKRNLKDIVVGLDGE